jgi:hypothetical protein
LQEEVATVNLQKYRQLQHQLEDAEERADVAENGLAKMRAKNRSSASLAPGGLSVSKCSCILRLSGILSFHHLHISAIPFDDVRLKFI